jgi:drug/metabolite transporter (DMT)-like permease
VCGADTKGVAGGADGGAAIRGIDRHRYAAGLVAGVATQLIWALAFLIPVLLAEQSALAITLGRYLAYGVVSLAMSAALRGYGMRGVLRREWAVAIAFAAAGNVGYYFLAVLAIAYAGAPAAAAIIGALPVTVALYGNWRRREFPVRRLALPIALLLAGMLVLNVAEWQHAAAGESRYSAGQRALGIACAVAALALWTWYGIANADFLKSRPHLHPGAWSTTIGVATLALVVAALPLVVLSDAGASALTTLQRGGPPMWWRFAIGSIVLGVVVSWGGTLLWNRASERLPVAMAGQLIVLETVAGMAYVFTAEQRIPSIITIVGVAILVVGVLLGIRRTRPSPGVGHRPSGSSFDVQSGRTA